MKGSDTSSCQPAATSDDEDIIQVNIQLAR